MGAAAGDAPTEDDEGGGLGACTGAGEGWACPDLGGVLDVILFFFFPVDFTGAEFFLFLPDLVTGPESSGEAPRSPSLLGSNSSCSDLSSMMTELGVW